jgi:type VI secretion system protein ImpH
MGSQRGREIPALIDQLLADPGRFDFFQAVRALQRQADHLAQTTGAKPWHGVGYDSAPEEEIIRFRAQQSLAFPAADIQRLEPCEPPEPGGVAGRPVARQRPPQMFVNFLGLTGPNGVLPRHYSQLVLEQLREGAGVLPAFLDLFNHRLISLFYRAWEKYQAGILVESNRYSPPREDVDLFSFALFCLLGLGTGGQRGRMAVADDVFLYFAGCFAHRPATAISLQRMLNEFLGTPVRVLQFRGQWLALAPEDQTRLDSFSAAVSGQLGRGAIVGERVWDVQSKFRVRIGPIGYAMFRQLMPSEDRLLGLMQFIRSYVGPEWDFDVQLVLRRQEVPWGRLDGSYRLGWNIWSRACDFQHDADDVVFCLPGV